jgi:hypothetical protein
MLSRNRNRRDALLRNDGRLQGLREGEEMPLICPTCQRAFDASMPGAATLHGVVFDIFESGS